MAKDNYDSTKEYLAGSRKIPQSIEAEESVLSCCLIDNNAAVYVMEELKEEDFFSSAHKVIFRAIASIMSAADIHNVLDVITLSNKLEQLGLLKDAGGVQYLVRLSSLVPNASNHRTHCDIVKGKARLRNIIEVCSNTVNDAYNNGDAADVLTRAEAELYSLSKDEERRALVHVEDVLPDVLTEFDRLKDPMYRKGIPTGFKNLDFILNGLHPTDLVLIAARPGIGKTALTMNIMGNVALGVGQKGPDKVKRRCAVFNLEMSKEQLTQRLLCQFSGVSMSKVNKGEMNGDDWKQIMLTNKRLSEAELYIDDTSYIKPQEIFNKCLRLKREKGLDVVMIDYLQLVTPNTVGREGNRAQEVAEITRFLKITAKELKVPILLLSQLSRKAEERKDKPPQLSDLRESGAIEQDADIVMFIHRVTPPEQADLKEQKVELVVAKHRNGALGNARMLWYPEQVMFRDDESPAPAHD